jgi:hypothetical protein
MLKYLESVYEKYYTTVFTAEVCSMVFWNFWKKFPTYGYDHFG